MSELKVIHCSDDLYEVYFPRNVKFEDFLRNVLKPDLRAWSPTRRCWVVVPEAVGLIRKVASDYFEDIYFTEKIPNSNYEILYLLPEAPIEVVKAAYKVLVKKYHPDSSTADHKKFLEISEAYKKILSVLDRLPEPGDGRDHSRK